LVHNHLKANQFVGNNCGYMGSPKLWNSFAMTLVILG
jgi:hypothetical protein